MSDDDHRSAVHGTSTVRLQEAAVRFGAHTAVQPLTLDVGPGELLSVGGHNGSGKTTLLRLMAGVVKPSSGTRAGPKRAAYVPAAVQPPPMPVQQWLSSIPRPRRSDPASAIAGLDRLGFRGSLAKSCRALSFGNLRKLLLVEAFSSGEDLVVIDEATSGLDRPGTEGLVELVTEAMDQGIAVVAADQYGRRALRFGTPLFLDGGRAVEPEGEGDDPLQAVLRLSGPPERVEQMLAAAAEFGFSAQRRARR